jgi:hypothetical protein
MSKQIARPADDKRGGYMSSPKPATRLSPPPSGPAPGSRPAPASTPKG